MAEVAARVSAAGQIMCVGLQTHRTRHWPLGETAALLEPYHVALKARARQQRDGLYLFAELTDETPSPFAGAQVLERKIAEWRQAA